MNTIVYFFFVISCVTAACEGSMEHIMQDKTDRVRDFLEDQIRSHKSPGLQYVVTGPDSEIFSYAGGWADVAALRPILPATTMMIYSMTKTVTAIAALQLVEKKKISLDDPVIDYIRDMPYGNGVSIRHLISQTSGIPNPIPLKWVHSSEEHSKFDESMALKRIMAENPRLDFKPGNKYRYSNISYWLLGRIIEKASGTGYEDYMRKNIFQRLKLPLGEIDFVIPSLHNHSKGYIPKWSALNLFKGILIERRFIGEYENGWLNIKDHYLNGPSFGGIVCSARAIGAVLRDLLKNDSALLDEKSKSLLFEQQRDNDGDPVEMTLGWHMRSTKNTSFFYKEGGGAGFHSEMRIYPRSRLASIIIANNASFDVKTVLDTVDREFLQ